MPSVCSVLRINSNFDLTSFKQPNFEAPIVRGMPYATIFYDGLTPVMKFGHAILSNSGSGTRYEVTLNNEQKWIIYASSDIRL